MHANPDAGCQGQQPNTDAVNDAEVGVQRCMCTMHVMAHACMHAHVGKHAMQSM